MVDGRWSRLYSRKLRLAFFTSASSRASVSTSCLLLACLLTIISRYQASPQPAAHILPAWWRRVSLGFAGLPLLLCGGLSRDRPKGHGHAYRQWQWQWCSSGGGIGRVETILEENRAWPRIWTEVLKRRCILLLPLHPPLSFIINLVAASQVIQAFPVLSRNSLIRAATNRKPSVQPSSPFAEKGDAAVEILCVTSEILLYSLHFSLPLF